MLKQLISAAILISGFTVPSATLVAQGSVFMNVPEALELAFPKCDVQRTRVAVTEEQQERISELAGNKLTERLVRPYVAKKDGKLIGTAYFDAHRVRTKRQVLMVVVTPDQVIDRVEVLAFGEPTDYIPRESWYDLFDGQPISDELRINSRIHNVTGSTLTTRATTNAARRILALHRVINGAPAVVADAKKSTEATSGAKAAKADATKDKTRTARAKNVGVSDAPRSRTAGKAARRDRPASDPRR